MNEPLSEADEHELAFIQANQKLIADCHKQAARDEMFPIVVRQLKGLLEKLTYGGTIMIDEKLAAAITVMKAEALMEEQQ